MKLEVVIENNGGDLWGRIKNKPQFFPTTVADTGQGVLNNLKMLIKDYLKHEGNRVRTGIKLTSAK